MDVVQCRRALCAVLPLVLFAVVRVAVATTIVEKDLDALAAEADRVFVGTVASVRSHWADPEQHHIETMVTFTNLDPLFGVDTSEIELRFGGGSVGDVTEMIAGVPTFTVGERVVVFASNQRAVSPIVGFNQGCMRIEGSGDAASVTLTTRARLGTMRDGRAVLADAASGEVAMPLSEFLADVRRRLATRGAIK
ncbi:MAG: hypothetical protein HYR72_26555 [Deltaproteobacteria bacterium]|nr:hypothetical protein [Deltaproteobacteria bacterium]MBI3390423.1 hypothetical protein [Deltaproteobacteria bacterium]